MKKEIIKLVKSDDGIFKLNNICCLRRWTKSALNEDVDKLALVFLNINNVNYGGIYYITARDYDGIIKECETAINQFLKNVSDRLIVDLEAGYRRGV